MKYPLPEWQTDRGSIKFSLILLIQSPLEISSRSILFNLSKWSGIYL